MSLAIFIVAVSMQAYELAKCPIQPPLPPTLGIPRVIHEPQDVKEIPVVKPTR